MKHPERVHSRQQLLDKVWGDHVFIEERTVDVHVKRLREALGRGGAWWRRCAAPATASRAAGPRAALKRPAGAPHARLLLRPVPGRRRCGWWLVGDAAALGWRPVPAGSLRDLRAPARAALAARGDLPARGRGLWGEAGPLRRARCAREQHRGRRARLQDFLARSALAQRRRAAGPQAASSGATRPRPRTSGWIPSATCSSTRQPGARPRLRALLQRPQLHAGRGDPRAGQHGSRPRKLSLRLHLMARAAS
jgi:hypothetical protein